MYVGKSQGPNLRPHLLQSKCCSRDTSETLDKSEEFINGKIGAAINKQVGGMLEQINEAINHRLKRLSSDSPGELQGRFTRNLGRLNIEPVMIRPHDSEFEVLAIRRMKIAVGQGGFEERSIRIPVPVEYDRIDVALRSDGNFLLE